jgi:hypothetical protein
LKVTDAVCVIDTESEVSVAVIVAVPATMDFTVKVAIPEAFVVPEIVVMVSVAPRLELSETDFPETKFPFESFKVTVIVEVALPSAVSETGEAVTVD